MNRISLKVTQEEFNRILAGFPQHIVKGTNPDFIFTSEILFIELKPGYTLPSGRESLFLVEFIEEVSEGRYGSKLSVFRLIKPYPDWRPCGPPYDDWVQNLPVFPSDSFQLHA